MAAPCTMELFRHDGEKAQRMSIERSEMAPTRRIEQDEEDVTMATRQGDEPAQDEEAADYLEALEDGRMDWCDINAIDQAKIRRPSSQRSLQRQAEEWRQEEPTAIEGARWVAPTGARAATNNTQESVINNTQESVANNTQERVANNTQESADNNTLEGVANNTNDDRDREIHTDSRGTTTTTTKRKEPACKMAPAEETPVPAGMAWVVPMMTAINAQAMENMRHMMRELQGGSSAAAADRDREVHTDIRGTTTEEHTAGKGAWRKAPKNENETPGNTNKIAGRFSSLQDQFDQSRRDQQERRNQDKKNLDTNDDNKEEKNKEEKNKEETNQIKEEMTKNKMNNCHVMLKKINNKIGDKTPEATKTGETRRGHHQGQGHHQGEQLRPRQPHRRAVRDGNKDTGGPHRQQERQGGEEQRGDKPNQGGNDQGKEEQLSRPDQENEQQIHFSSRPLQPAQEGPEQGHHGHQGGKEADGDHQATRRQAGALQAAQPQAGDKGRAGQEKQVQGAAQAKGAGEQAAHQYKRQDAQREGAG